MGEGMKTREGIAASLGFAIGPAVVVGREEYPIRNRRIEPSAVAAEESRFGRACEAAEKEISSLCEEVEQRVGKDAVSIFQGHFAHLRDPYMRKEIIVGIRRYKRSAEYAVSCYFRRKFRKIETQSPALFSARVLEDVADIERRLLKHLAGGLENGAIRLKAKSVIVAHNLSPVQTIDLDREKVLGIVTEAGGPTSHTALIARAYGIPAVVGLGAISTDVTSGDMLVVNGSQGIVVIHPDEETLKRYRAQARNFYLIERRLTDELRDLRAETKDGLRVEILANIELPEEIPSALDYGVEGIGLFRTEFLYLREGHEPTEEEQLRQYRKAVELLGRRKLVVRTVDLGMDKLPQDGWLPERNPFLGTRAIRLSLQRPDMFRTQLRAILRASAGGDVRLMFPMISSLEEFREARKLYDEVCEALRREKEVFDEKIPVGMMVEVPAAALIVDLFAPEVEFFSIGTNDLIQYAVAVDRVNERIAPLYQPTHPAILRMVRDVLAAAQRTGRPTAVCGEMSSDPLFTLLLLGLGLREFSVVPPAAPEIKKLIRSVTLDDAKAIAERALQMTDAKAIAHFLQERTREILPGAS